MIIRATPQPPLTGQSRTFCLQSHIRCFVVGISLDHYVAGHVHRDVVVDLHGRLTVHVEASPAIHVFYSSIRRLARPTSER